MLWPPWGRGACPGRLCRAIACSRARPGRHLWAKAVKKWKRFSVRGLVKAGIEATWVALAYNVAQWIRIRKVGTATA